MLSSVVVVLLSSPLFAISFARCLRFFRRTVKTFLFIVFFSFFYFCCLCICTLIAAAAVPATAIYSRISQLCCCCCFICWRVAKEKSIFHLSFLFWCASNCHGKTENVEYLMSECLKKKNRRVNFYSIFYYL